MQYFNFLYDQFYYTCIHYNYTVAINVNTYFKMKVQWLQEQMIAQDFTVSAIHGDQPPEERKLIMKV